MASVSGDYDLSTGDGQFHARILGAVARKESDDKSRRILRKHEELAKEGRRSGGGTRGFGYEQDRVTIKEDEAALIRDAAKRILAGESMRGICSKWEPEGIATVTGTRWTATVLKRILTAPGTAGLREHHGALYEGDWPGIIDRKTHERLKAILLDPARSKFNPGTARKYLLTGFAYCGLCDARLVARPRADGARCYVCASGVGFHGCGKIRSLAEPLEEFIKEAILQRISSPRLSEALKQDDEANDQELLDSLREDELALEQLARDHYADNLHY
jgi:site-specific DNA recombinase